MSETRYRKVLRVIRALLRLFSRMRVTGVENFPAPPYVLVTNHLSMMDIPFIGANAPDPITVFVASKYQKGPYGWLMGWVGAIFVHRGEADRQALKDALKVLRAGRVIGMAPEGTRSPTGALQKGKDGAAFLALLADVPIIPVAVTGSEHFLDELRHLHRPELFVKFGKPFRLERPEKRDSASLERLTDEIMQQIAALLPVEYRGVYGGRVSPEGIGLYGMPEPPLASSQPVAPQG